MAFRWSAPSPTRQLCYALCSRNPGHKSAAKKRSCGAPPLAPRDQLWLPAGSLKNIPLRRVVRLADAHTGRQVKEQFIVRAIFGLLTYQSQAKISKRSWTPASWFGLGLHGVWLLPCFFFGVLFVGLLVRVYIKAPDFWKLPYPAQANMISSWLMPHLVCACHPR